MLPSMVIANNTIMAMMMACNAVHQMANLQVVQLGDLHHVWACQLPARLQGVQTSQGFQLRHVHQNMAQLRYTVTAVH